MALLWEARVLGCHAQPEFREEVLVLDNPAINLLAGVIETGLGVGPQFSQALIPIDIEARPIGWLVAENLGTFRKVSRRNDLVVGHPVRYAARSEIFGRRTVENEENDHKADPCLPHFVPPLFADGHPGRDCFYPIERPPSMLMLVIDERKRENGAGIAAGVSRRLFMRRVR
ncbi:MAG: hypothetical protein PVJ53_17035 [Desulfobacterales bacterium]|jgi:hypothetical protein